MWDANEKTVVAYGAPESITIYNEQTGEWSEPIYQDISKITRITVPGEVNGYTVIEARGFMGLPALEEITFSEGIKQLGEQTLAGCPKLEQINLPNSLEGINTDCFNFCTALTEITLPDNLYQFEGSILGTAFVGCNKLKKLNILCKHPEWILSMTNIQYQDWEGNPLPEYTNLRETVESIYFGPNVGNFSQHAPFPNLKSIIVDEANTQLDSRDGCNAVIWTPGDKLIKGCNTTIVPNSVTSIGGNAFNGTQISELKLSPSITSIGGYAFANCNMLTEVALCGDDHLFVGNNAFDNCQNLRKISFGPQTTLYTPLNNCPALEEITLGENWSLYDYSYDAKIYQDCYNVKLVTLGETYFCRNTLLWQNGFYYDGEKYPTFRRDMVVRSFITEPSRMFIKVGVSYDFESGTSEEIYPQKLFVPKGTKSIYEQTEEWSKCAEIIEMEDTDVDGIVTCKTDLQPQIINLSGQRLSTPKKGVNIINGRKIFIN